MRARPLFQVSVPTTAESEDAVIELLSTVLDQPASTYTDARTGRTVARVYLNTQDQFDTATQRRLKEGLERIRLAGLIKSSPRIGTRLLPAENWAESWKLHFKPLEIGKALLIKPSWNRKKPQKNQALVVLDPGLSFGTGQHPTTRFCLEQLVTARQAGMYQSFLDVGCGSGILAIGAAKLGYRPVHAFDFDPDAVRIARENAGRNKLSGLIQFSRQDVTRLSLRPARRFDVVCANLTSDLLVSELRRLLARLKPGGRIVLAGILFRQFAEVQNAAEKIGLRMIANDREGEWKSAAFTWGSNS